MSRGVPHILACDPGHTHRYRTISTPVPPSVHEGSRVSCQSASRPCCEPSRLPRQGGGFVGGLLRKRVHAGTLSSTARCVSWFSLVRPGGCECTASAGAQGRLRASNLALPIRPAGGQTRGAILYVWCRAVVQLLSEQPSTRDSPSKKTKESRSSSLTPGARLSGADGRSLLSTLTTTPAALVGAQGRAGGRCLRRSTRETSTH